jgi:hypothetical protein
MFALIKAGDTWTLHYHFGRVWHVIPVAAGLAMIVIWIFRPFDAHAGSAAISGSVLVGVLCLALVAYWLLCDIPTATVFDLAQRRLSVHSSRPWFGPPRVFAFADVAELAAVRHFGEPGNVWEVRLQLRDDTRIRLGFASEARSERIRGHLAEIEQATGIDVTVRPR